MSTPTLDFDPATVALPQGHVIGGAYDSKFVRHVLTHRAEEPHAHNGQAGAAA